MKKEELIKEITRVFKELPVPERVVLGNDSEYLETEKEFKGKKWKELLKSDLGIYYRDSIFLLSPEAFCYYIPAYLIHAIMENDDSVETIMFCLTPPKFHPYVPERFSRGSEKYYNERYKLFNIEQKKELLSFIKYFDEEHSEDFIEGELDPLIKYWNQLINKSESR